MQSQNMPNQSSDNSKKRVGYYLKKKSLFHHGDFLHCIKNVSNRFKI